MARRAQWTIREGPQIEEIIYVTRTAALDKIPAMAERRGLQIKRGTFRYDGLDYEGIIENYHGFFRFTAVNFRALRDGNMEMGNLGAVVKVGDNPAQDIAGSVIILNDKSLLDKEVLENLKFTDQYAWDRGAPANLDPSVCAKLDTEPSIVIVRLKHEIYSFIIFRNQYLLVHKLPRSKYVWTTEPMSMSDILTIRAKRVIKDQNNMLARVVFAETKERGKPPASEEIPGDEEDWVGAIKHFDDTVYPLSNTERSQLLDGMIFNLPRVMAPPGFNRRLMLGLHHTVERSQNGHYEVSERRQTEKRGNIDRAPLFSICFRENDGSRRIFRIGQPLGIVGDQAIQILGEHDGELDSNRIVLNAAIREDDKIEVFGFGIFERPKGKRVYDPHQKKYVFWLPNTTVWKPTEKEVFEDRFYVFKIDGVLCPGKLSSEPWPMAPVYSVIGHM